MVKISVLNVTKQFSSVTAVDGLSCEIPAGSVFGLLGPNGAGKTTLIRMLMDIIRPDSGQILIDGHTLTNRDKDRITYLPEERGLYRKEKVRSILEYFGRLKGVSRSRVRKRIETCLARLEMSAILDTRVEELSKGNQQKVQLASVLVSDPEVIILDEPFSGFDPVNVRIAKDVLMEERAHGKTILLSTHQMNQVEELCDRLLMIHQGRRVLYGSVDEILDRYSEPAVLLECPPLDGEVPGIERVVPSSRFQKVYLRDGTGVSEVLKELIERGVPIDGVQKAVTSLEQIFVRIVRSSEAESQPESPARLRAGGGAA